MDANRPGVESESVRVRGVSDGKRADVRVIGRSISVLACAAVCCVVVACDERAEAGESARLDVRRVLGEPGRAPGQLMYPRGIASADAQLWVVDKAARVQRIDTETGRGIRLFSTPKFDNGKPTGITLAPMPGDDARLGLYVADTHEHRVIVYDVESGSDEPALEFGSVGIEDGQFTYPTDIAVLTDKAGRVERIYVSEYGGHDRISAFSPEFEFLFDIGAFGVAHEGDNTEHRVVFDRPQSIAVDSVARELIVTDACNHRVGRFTLDGEHIAWIGGGTSDLLRYPYGLELIGNRQALIVEFGGNRVTRLDLDSGEVLEVIGEPGREPGQLASPWGVAAIGDELFVLDSGNNRIQVVKLSGVPLAGGAR